jgi:hypothetical protein
VCAFFNDEPEAAYYILGYKVVENVSRALDAAPLGRGFLPGNFYLFIPGASCRCLLSFYAFSLLKLYVQLVNYAENEQSCLHSVACVWETALHRVSLHYVQYCIGLLHGGHGILWKYKFISN